MCSQATSHGLLLFARSLSDCLFITAPVGVAAPHVVQVHLSSRIAQAGVPLQDWVLHDVLSCASLLVCGVVLQGAADRPGRGALLVNHPD
jgi:hypothetical protein